MSKLVSSAEFKKSDGSPIVFNFQFENGLPVKNIINATYKQGHKKSDNSPCLLVVLEKKDECIFRQEDSVLNVYFESKSKGIDLWIEFDSFYVYLELIDAFENEKFHFWILDSNNNILVQLLLNAN